MKKTLICFLTIFFITQILITLAGTTTYDDWGSANFTKWVNKTFSISSMPYVQTVSGNQLTINITGGGVSGDRVLIWYVHPNGTFPNMGNTSMNITVKNLKIKAIRATQAAGACVDVISEDNQTIESRVAESGPYPVMVATTFAMGNNISACGDSSDTKTVNTLYIRRTAGKPYIESSIDGVTYYKQNVKGLNSDRMWMLRFTTVVGTTNINDKAWLQAKQVNYTVGDVAPTVTLVNFTSDGGATCNGAGTECAKTEDTTPTFTLTTNENAKCRLSNLNESYNAMANNINCTQAGSWNTSHTCTWSPAQGVGNRLYFFGCGGKTGINDTSPLPAANKANLTIVKQIVGIAYTPTGARVNNARAIAIHEPTLTCSVTDLSNSTGHYNLSVSVAGNYTVVVWDPNNRSRDGDADPGISVT